MPDRIEKTIEVTGQTDAVEAIAASTGLSKTRIKLAMTRGAIWLGRGKQVRRLRRTTRTLQPGDTLIVNYDEGVLAAEAPSPSLIADEESFSVWFKPAGVMSSGSRFGDHTAIDRMVERELDRATFLVHRLDQYATGLIVLAHSKSAAADLATQFRNRSVEKRYQAIVEGCLHEPLTIDTPLDDRTAITHVTPRETGTTVTLVDVRIETGRKHQIRRHLASIGHPVIGDRLYGNTTDSPLRLTACELAFDAPSGGRFRYELPASQRPHLP